MSLLVSIDADVVRGMEGDSAARYFGVFDHLILSEKTTFAFSGRTRRPSRDPVNAMLSSGYALLLNDCLAAAARYHQLVVHRETSPATLLTKCANCSLHDICLPELSELNAGPLGEICRRHLASTRRVATPESNDGRKCRRLLEVDGRGWIADDYTNQRGSEVPKWTTNSLSVTPAS